MIQRNDLLGAFFCLEIDKGFSRDTKERGGYFEFCILTDNTKEVL